MALYLYLRGLLLNCGEDSNGDKLSRYRRKCCILRDDVYGLLWWYHRHYHIEPCTLQITCDFPGPVVDRFDGPPRWISEECGGNNGSIICIIRHLTTLPASILPSCPILYFFFAFPALRRETFPMSTFPWIKRYPRTSPHPCTLQFFYVCRTKKIPIPLSILRYRTNF